MTPDTGSAQDKAAHETGHWPYGTVFLSDKCSRMTSSVSRSAGQPRVGLLVCWRAPPPSSSGPLAGMPVNFSAGELWSLLKLSGQPQWNALSSASMQNGCSRLAAPPFQPRPPCRKCRGSPMLKPAIDRPSRQPRATIVVKNVAVDYLKKAGGRVPKHGQVIESKGETSWGIHPRSTEPKAVSGLLRKCLVFRYLLFNEMRAAC